MAGSFAVRQSKTILAFPQATEWQRIGNQINAAMNLCAGELHKRAES